MGDIQKMEKTIEEKLKENEDQFVDLNKFNDDYQQKKVEYPKKKEYPQLNFVSFTGDMD